MTRIPEGFSEAEVMEIIDRVARRQAKKFRFGYYDKEDIFQEGRYWAWEGLKRYDAQGWTDGKPNRPLENFLQRHVSNRLMNLKRNKLRRLEFPCQRCHDNDPCDNGNYCERHKRWDLRNRLKAANMQPMTLLDSDERHGQGETAAENRASEAELTSRLDQELPGHLRADYLRMLAGVKIPEARQEVVRAAVREILYGEEGEFETL